MTTIPSRNLRFVLPLVSLVSPVLAQDFLEPTVVSASRIEQEQLDTPYSVAVIDKDQIINEQMRTVPEALRNVSGVLIQKTTHGHGSPFIRGFTGRQNLLLVDGVRMNNSTWRSGPVQYWNTLDVYAVDRMELVKGPGSVMYGSDSLGGTLNLFSKSALYRDAQGFFQDGGVYYRFDTNSQSHVGRLEQRIGEGGKWGLHLGASVKSYGDIRDSFFGQMNRTGYPEQNVDLKYSYALSDTTQMDLAFQYLNQDDIWRWHSTTLSERGNNGTSWVHQDHVTEAGSLDYRYYDQERFLTYAKFSGTEGAGLLEQWTSTISYQKSQDSETRSDPRWGVANVQTFGASFQASSATGPGQLIWGGDFYHDAVKTDASDPSRRPVADGSRYDSFGAFAQYNWDVVENFNFDLGARASYFDAAWDRAYNRNLGRDESGSGNWGDISFSARGTYSLSNDWALYGGVSEGFRAPNLADLTGSTVSRSRDEVIGSSDLDAEKVLSFELGTKADWRDVTMSVAGFYTAIRNPITSAEQTIDGVDYLRLTNGEEGYIWGFEGDAAWRITEQWELFGNLTYQDGKQKSRAEIGGPVVEDTVSRLMPLSGNVRLRWTQTGGKYWVEGQVLGAVTQDNLSRRDVGDDQRIPSNGTPGYLVGSVRGGWQAQENLLVTLGIENVSDEDYRVHGSGLNETGLNALLGIKYDW
ncbi:TonB-dependent receptor plug domain-containing protein [Rubritalea tangerina]|uniref:TonB-dependent receptor plug domain-containing protein n=1 Tax=Rubritalea tangerina TaxID=430798 RepID=A0ABW4ZB75_9BACT